jgi:hypothetical protein
MTKLAAHILCLNLFFAFFQFAKGKSIVAASQIDKHLRFRKASAQATNKKPPPKRRGLSRKSSTLRIPN